MSKFNNGDIVRYTRKYRELFDDEFTVGEKYVVVDGSYECIPSGIKLEDMDGNSKTYMTEGNFELVSESNIEANETKVNNLGGQMAPFANENRSQPAIRKLKVATFTARNGEEVTIKRSKCRHYLLKEGNKPQRRVPMAVVAPLLAVISTTL